jgi:hypothetical protein
MIPLTEYALMHSLDHRDALNHAVDCGLDIHVYAHEYRDGSKVPTIDTAAEIAQEDPSLVSIRGTDEQTGMTAGDLSVVAAAGFDAPEVVDALAGYVVVYPPEGEWGVARSREDGDWWLCYTTDGVVDESRSYGSLDAALAEATERNDD